MTVINFTKMEGTSNDFVVLDGINNNFNNPNRLAKILCHRKKGVGADQLVILCNSSKADFRMNNYNPDGNQVEICGNALRALALYIYEHNFSNKKEFRIETLAGIKIALINDDMTCTINMKKPSFNSHDIGLSDSTITSLTILDRVFDIHCVSMGNPHCVIILENGLESFPLEIYGPLIEKHSLFNNHTNVEFIERISSNHLKMRVWERSVGITDSCGSGACASAVIGITKKIVTSDTVKISLPGGELLIEWKNHQDILMTGQASSTFSGEFTVV